MKKLFVVIPSNRTSTLHPKTISVIEKTKTHVIFVKQNLPSCYKKHPYIHEIISHQTGASLARNLGIKNALFQQAKIIAFTDDDCIITNTWIKNINKIFSNSKIDAVFGRISPYQPQKNIGKKCPCTFSKKNNNNNILIPVSSLDSVGMTGNLVINSKIIDKIGLFNTKIGPGTIIPGGEDTDFILRIINRGFLVYYSHSLRLYHNEWLSLQEIQTLYQKYTLSFAYIYSYHTYHTNVIYSIVLIKGLIKEFMYYIKYAKQIFHPFSFIKLILNHNLIIYNFLKGCILSFTYP